MNIGNDDDDNHDDECNKRVYGLRDKIENGPINPGIGECKMHNDGRADITIIKEEVNHK
jgi:hypothetical protein